MTTAPSRLAGWLRPTGPQVETVAPERRRVVVVEVVVVLLVTLGLSGLRSVVSLLDSLASPTPLAQQTVALNAPQARVGLLDLAAQLLSTTQLVAWGALGAYLLWRGIGTAPRGRDALCAVGLDRRRPAADAAGGATLAALIGIPGLGLSLLARAAGLNLTVLPATLDDTWWRVPALVASAAGNAWAEEVLVVAYLLTRLRQLGVGENRSLLLAALLRGSYHLYQGFGGFVGNVVMGLVFGRVFQRTSRVLPLVVGHTLIDIVAFVGYALLGARLGLPF